MRSHPWGRNDGIDNLNADFLKAYPYIHTIRMEGQTRNWEITVEKTVSSDVHIPAERSSVLSGKKDSWEF